LQIAPRLSIDPALAAALRYSGQVIPAGSGYAARRRVCTRPPSFHPYSRRPPWLARTAPRSDASITH